MAGLKSFLYGAAPILGTTGAALYERQRALVNLKVLKAAAGRGPGSGVPLTAYGVAAVVISVLAVENLSEVDERVVAIINAMPEPVRLFAVDQFSKAWMKAGKPTFCDAVGAALSGGPMPWPLHTKHRPVFAIRVTRCWRGQLVTSPSGASPTEYRTDFPERNDDYFTPIQITAEIAENTLASLRSFTAGALSQTSAEEDNE